MKEKNLVSNFKHRRKNNYYKRINFMSSYEVELAKNLDIHNIKWILPKRFKYYVNNDIKDKYHYYTPDFYLPYYNIYLDPKNDFLINNINPKLGYNDIDKINWVMQQNNIRVLILTKEQLRWEIIKTLI